MFWSWGRLFFIFGCGGGSSGNLWDQINQLGQERKTLETEVEQLRADNKELSGQVEKLVSIGPEVRVDVLSTVSKIELGKRTGLFDKNKDGKLEKLIVYLKPIDDSGDGIKAIGAVDVELWDLNAEVSDARIRKWRVEPRELKKLWAMTFMSTYYRLSFDVGDMLGDDMGELTVKVTFTDYLTGKVFRGQAVILRN